MKRLVTLLLATTFGALAQTGGAGYVPDGSYVWAGVIAPPRIVPAVDETVARRPQIWCALYDVDVSGGGVSISDRRIITPQNAGAYALQCFEAVPPTVPAVLRPPLGDLAARRR